MKAINANTKLAVIFESHPRALDAIVSISSKFKKLHNPFLRKLMAGRTSIAMASKLGGCSVDDFLNVLKPLGFVEDENQVAKDHVEVLRIVPLFMENLQLDKIIELDVRPVIDLGKDPLGDISRAVKKLKAGEVLKIINSFEPVPLINLLVNQGFESYTDQLSDDLVNTYFYKSIDIDVKEKNEMRDTADWNQVIKRFKGKLEEIDVRNLEMPQPMYAILESLSSLAPGKALFVFHKRIPVFLLPELEARQFNYRINEISEGDVNLLIYKD